jgi:two-component system sensor histidine kinase BaeS
MSHPTQPQPATQPTDPQVPARSRPARQPRRNRPDTQWRGGFATRLLVVQALVLVASAVTSWLVATAVAPRIFHLHLQRAGVPHLPAEAAHVEEAFTSALLISLLVALLAAVVLALAVTWYFSRRLQRAVAAVADSASEVAAGRYSSRIPQPGLGVEFDQLTTTFNQLAHRLDATETTRRRMLADLGHEMRTPLATLDAHLEALEDGVRTLDDTTLAVLRASTQRLGRLAQDISAVSQAQEGTLQIHCTQVTARQLIGTAVQAARDGYRAEGVALIEGATSDTVLSADPERIEQVLGNLLDNALRHTPTGGTATVTSTAGDRWVELIVKDTGEGIEPEHLTQVFDRFYRADTSRNRLHGGSGIGLTISKAIVEAHKGRISAYSAGPGTGTTFTVSLPRTPH